jgi:hypothetical protein
VGLAYHVFRSDTGVPLSNDPTQGQFLLATVAEWNLLRMRMSSRLSSDKPPGVDTRFIRAGYLWDDWARTLPGTGITLFEDESLTAAKGVMFHAQAEGTQRLLFMGYADGSAPQMMKDGNDFQVMERGICAGVLSGNTSWCGTSNKWGY